MIFHVLKVTTVDGQTHGHHIQGNFLSHMEPGQLERMMDQTTLTIICSLSKSISVYHVHNILRLDYVGYLYKGQLIQPNY